MMRTAVSRITIERWTPGATMPLILPVQLVCNAPETLVTAHITENSRNPSIEWVKTEPEHGTAAILCGSGPSIGDYVADIRAHQEKGAHVFALNAAATWLWERDVMPDFQVMIDSRKRMVDFVGPAKKYLFASQVAPEAFAMCPGAKQFHLALENIEEILPKNYPEHALIGGGASVGTTALALVNALGYRTIHCYGVDSSNNPDDLSQSHAKHQPLNDGEPMCEVKFDGKIYKASLTMAYQADRFMLVAEALKAVGTTISVHGYGLLPARFNATPEKITEAEKYRRMWEYESYRVTSHGEKCTPTFLEVAKPPEGSTVIDFGCGTGRGAIALKEAGLVPTTVDIADNCREHEALRLPFYLHDMREPLPNARADYGFCCDMMEHVPTDAVVATLTNIMDCAPIAFFQINTLPDAMGVHIEQPLHLTVKPFKWWKKTFEDLGCEILWSDYDIVASQFLVRKPRKESA
jgi:hypothetical protein